MIRDQNGDGTRDIALERGEWIDRRKSLASIEVLSSRTLEFIRRFDLSAVERPYGSWCMPGDLDLDGSEDLIIWGHTVRRSDSRPIAVSGTTQRVIPGWQKRMKKHRGYRFVPAGDLDGDGAGDLFLSDRKNLPTREIAMTLLAVSGRSGEVLAQHVRTLPDTDGSRIVPLPDLDGDGRGELLLTNHGADGWSTRTPVVSVHSGADLSVLHVLEKHAGYFIVIDHFGFNGCALEDINGDGVADVAVCAMNPYGNSQGAVQIFSGKDGQSLRLITKNSLQERRLAAGRTR